MSRASSFFFWVEMTRSNRPGFAGAVSGTTDCAAALAAAKHDRTTLREIARFHMVRCGGKAARVHTRWIRRRIQLLYTADRKSTRLNSSHTEIYTLSLHDALPIYHIERDRAFPHGSMRRKSRQSAHSLDSPAHTIVVHRRSEEHTSELQSHRDLHSFPTRRSSDLPH